MYLKFVWGRSRLPIDLTNLEDNHSVYIDEYNDDNIQHLPMSCTCGFNISIPGYKSEKVMRSKLLTAITLCGEIDNDGDAETDFNGDRIPNNNREEEEE